MTKPKPKLKPCPFCGSNGVYVKEDTGLISAGCSMWCATSVQMDTHEEAAEWWNMRKRPKARKEQA